MNSKIVIGLVIGLIVGLVLGVFIGVIISPNKSVAELNNQVRVSGTISETGFTTIEFTTLNLQTNTSALIINGGYNITLVGGQSYTVVLNDQFGNVYPVGGLQVPSGVTTFTANF